MNSKQIKKWFYDHNIIIQQNNDMDRLKYLTFLASVFLGLDEECSFDGDNISMDLEMEDYYCDMDTELLLNCTNRYYGYYHKLFVDTGFSYMRRHDIQTFDGTYVGLKDYFRNAKKDIWDYKNYDFDCCCYYNGRNTFFYSKDLELTEEDMTFLKEIREDQDSFELSRSHGELVIF
ncbi:MAG: hypothetical protein IJ193_02385 [Bacilli bacterium]|nr:hypothetical protein [Bacilli bacterium]